MSDLNGRNVLVTGGGRGIGKEIALALARQGARVAIGSRTQSELQETVAHARLEGLSIQAYRMDVSRPEDISQVYNEFEANLGPIFGLICAAGVYGPIGPFEECNLDEWEMAIRINLVGTARCVHEAIRRMKKGGGGRIVLFSGGGEKSLANFSAYVTSKGGVWRFTETVAAEVFDHKIYINAIAPGAVNTRLLENLLEAGAQRVGKDFYERSLKQKSEGGVPAEKAASLTGYLLSERAAGLSGKVLSAVWDRPEAIEDTVKVTRSDLYTMRRVIRLEGTTH